MNKSLIKPNSIVVSVTGGLCPVCRRALGEEVESEPNALELPKLLLIQFRVGKLKPGGRSGGTRSKLDGFGSDEGGPMRKVRS